MPFYEFECPAGHVTETLLPLSGAKIMAVTCTRCARDQIKPRPDVMAKRILSPTPTTFVCAGGRKL